MLGLIAKKIFGTKNEREIKKIKPIVEKINALEPELDELSNKEIRERSLKLIEKVRNDEQLKDAITSGEIVDILPEAFALVREAAKRTLGLRPFDVQLIGAVALHKGMIAEMKTGEGKTLVASIAIYLNALTGRGVHLVTVNDYLAKRDAVQMGTIYKFLGLSVGAINTNNKSFTIEWVNEDKFKEAIENDMRVWPKGYKGELLPSEKFNVDARKNFFTHAVETERRKAYEADITYGTNNEFGFDYLRDNMVFSKDQIVQVKGHHYAIIDEVDSILIDEARTPLIISGPSGEDVSIYYSTDAFVKTLIKDEDFIVDEKNKTAVLTEKGIEKAEKYFGLDNLFDPKNIEILHAINQSLRANYLFHRDVDYVVKDGQVIIVDEFTGRLMPGRRWSDGLHQAIEAKEGVKIEAENQTLASITFQNYFRMYKKLAGMTGTAETEATEFKEIYNLDVLVIPTNKPVIRKDYPDVIYKTKNAKFKHVVEEIEELHKKGRPVLVGTASIETSEYLSSLLKKRGIKHHVLNAKHHEKEAEIIAQAGRVGAVTIATNMAGRGTDILLGGNPEFLAKEILKKKGLTPEEATEEQYREALKEAQKITAEEKKKVIELGGLAVIGTERHESRRIDNQLRGRSGRQGDPGASQFYLSLEDNLLRIFGSDKIKSIMERLGIEEGEHIESRMVTRAVENAQKKVESLHYESRKHILEYDDVANEQRKVVYEFRNNLLDPKFSLAQKIEENRQEYIGTVLSDAGIFDGIEKDEFDLDKVIATFKDELYVEFLKEDLQNLEYEELFNKIEDGLKGLYEEKMSAVTPEQRDEIEKMVYLQILDNGWREHLYQMDILKTGIGLRGYNQKDPLTEYKKESYDMFVAFINSIKTETTKMLQLVQLQSEEETQNALQEMEEALEVSNDDMKLNLDEEVDANVEVTKPVKAEKKVPRNDPCPCGSGQKYKNCCGKSGPKKGLLAKS